MTIEEPRLAAALLSGGVPSSAISGAVLAGAHRANPQRAAILDFGSGGGRLLPLLAARLPGAALHAADIMERPADLAADMVRHRGDPNLDLSVPAATFDLVVRWS